MNTEQKYTITWSSAWIGLIIALILPYIIMGASIFLGAQVLSTRIEAIAQDAEQEIARLESKFDGIVADVEQELTPVIAAIDEVVKEVEQDIATVETFIANIEADVARVEKTVDGIVAGAEQEFMTIEKGAESAIQGFVHEVNVALTKAGAYGHLLAAIATHKTDDVDGQSLATVVEQVVKELDVAYTDADADAQKEWRTLQAEYDQIVNSLQSATDATTIDTLLGQLETLVEASLTTEGNFITRTIDQVAKEIGLDEETIEPAIDNVVNTIELGLRKAEVGGRLAMLLASDVADNNAKAIAQDITQVIRELDEAYASASTDAQTEWATLKPELTQAAQALENETTDAVQSTTTIVNQYLAHHPETLDIIVGLVLTEAGIRSPEIHNVVTEIVQEIGQNRGDSSSS